MSIKYENEPNLNTALFATVAIAGAFGLLVAESGPPTIQFSLDNDTFKALCTKMPDSSYATLEGALVFRSEKVEEYRSSGDLFDSPRTWYAVKQEYNLNFVQDQIVMEFVHNNEKIPHVPLYKEGAIYSVEGLLEKGRDGHSWILKAFNEANPMQR